MLVLRGVEFLAEGAARGQRLVVVGTLGPWSERIERELRASTDLAEGQLLLIEAADVYAIGRPIDAEAQLAAYDAMIERAMTDGYSGLCVLAEGSALLAPELIESHVAWEARADRFMVGRPLDGLCCFDARAVGSETTAALVSVHADPDPERPWMPRVFALPEGAVGLAGELDSFASPQLRRALDVACGEAEELVLDLGRVTFLDHGALLALAEFTAQRRAAGADVTVRDAPPLTRVLTQVCGVSL